MTASRRLRGMLALMLAVTMAGCGQPPSAPRTPDRPPVDGDSAARWAASVKRVASATDADVDGTIAGLWAFADRFSSTTAHPDQNGVFSPAGIGYAFGMLRGGSGGDTAAQLDKVFGFPDTVHDAFGVMRRDIVSTDEPPPKSKPDSIRDPNTPPKPPIVAIANGLFLQENYRIRADYERMLREVYGAGAQYVDFASGRAGEEIDAWVKEQTADRIDKLFDRLDPSTVAVLANAVYLKADWTMPFDESQTKNEPFRLGDGGTVRAPMMRFAKPVKLNHVRGDGWQAVELPYAGGELAMWVLVPTGDDLRPPLLSAATLADLGDAERKIVDLSLPRWDFGWKAELLGPLARLGVTDLHNLPGFGGGTFVGQAIHRANITVDEYGTEAAAVTGIAVTTSLGPPPAVTMRADRPFTFAIVHKPTGAPMFLGTVANPTES